MARPDKPAQIGGQIIEELDRLINMADQIKPYSYLEIGAREGIALRYFVERVPSIKRVTVVDLPGAQWGKVGSEVKLMENLDALDAESVVHLGDSTDPEIVRLVSEHRYSVVFIDGDHSYEGVCEDVHNYLPLADDLLCLHDINHPRHSQAYGPSLLWQELKANHPDNTREFIAQNSRKGIGVILL